MVGRRRYLRMRRACSSNSVRSSQVVRARGTIVDRSEFVKEPLKKKGATRDERPSSCSSVGAHPQRSSSGPWRSTSRSRDRPKPSNSPACKESGFWPSAFARSHVAQPPLMMPLSSGSVRIRNVVVDLVVIEERVGDEPQLLASSPMPDLVVGWPFLTGYQASCIRRSEAVAGA